jgi:ABC-type sugar transport system permease subunit
MPGAARAPTRWPRLRQALPGYAMLLPALVLLAVFVVAPVLYGLYQSLLRWSGFEPPVFIGFDNYARLWERDRIFRHALANNVIFAISVVVGKNVLGLFLALLLNQRLWGSTFFRPALFLPVTMSFVVVGLLWSWIYNPTFGLLDAGLRAIGLEALSRPWLSDPSTALWAIIAVDIWKWTGFHMVLYLAGLQTIPRDLYEAATIDGAGRWRQLLDVTLPMLAPVTFVNVLLALNGAFVRNFDLVYVMTGGGPNHQTEVVLTHMVAEAFRQGNLGYSAAMGYVLFAIVAVISAVYIRMARAGAHDF